MALSLPSLWIGLAGDDYFHRAMFLGLGTLSEHEPIWDMFTFFPGGEGNATFFELGLLPWWSDPGLRAAFFRPLSALTHLLDYALWPDSPMLQHLHSLLWAGLGAAIVARVYRALPMAPAAAGFAALLFVCEDAHAVPAGWIANRNALVCLVFGGLALWGHIASERRADRRLLAASVAVFGVGLFAGEATLGAAAYIVAFQATMAPGRWPGRLARLVPYGVLIVGWRLLYNALGYGASGSGLYIDPGRQPVDFGLALLERWPMMIASLWLQLPIDGWMVLHRPYQLVFVGIACVSVGLVAAWLLPAAARRAEVRMWLLGMALSTVPLCAAFPMDRLLLFPGLGAFGLLGLLLSEPMPGWRHRATRLLAVVHGPIAAALLVGKSAGLPLFGLLFSAGARQAPADPALAEQTLIFVNGTELMTPYVPIMRTVEPALGPPPRRLAQLSAMTTATEVRREDADTLVVVPEGGLLRGSLEALFWGTGHRFQAGERIQASDFEAEIREVTADGRPAVVAYHFREPLESASYRWVYWTTDGLVRFPLPAAGEGTRLPVTLPTLWP